MRSNGGGGVSITVLDGAHRCFPGMDARQAAGRRLGSVRPAQSEPGLGYGNFAPTLSRSAEIGVLASLFITISTYSHPSNTQ